jgi:hypothetical protein
MLNTTPCLVVDDNFNKTPLDIKHCVFHGLTAPALLIILRENSILPFLKPNIHQHRSFLLNPLDK